jgi:hypothetical protein
MGKILGIGTGIRRKFFAAKMAGISGTKGKSLIVRLGGEKIQWYNL